MDKAIKLLNRLISISALILLIVIFCGVLWNMGHYSGKVAGEAGVLLFKQELRESLEQGYTFKWDEYRFIPARTRTNGMKNVMVTKVSTTTEGR